MPDHHRGRRSMYEHSKTAASAPGDEAGPYSWMQLEAMNERFRHALSAASSAAARAPRAATLQRRRAA
jgi:hypothetical protein